MNKASFKDYLQTQGHTEGHAERTIQQTNDYIQWLTQSPESTTYTDLIHYLEHLQTQTLKTTTQQRKLVAIKHYYHYLMKQNQIDQNPAIHIKLRNQHPRKQYPVLSEDQLTQLHENYTYQPKTRTTKTTEAMHYQKKLTLGLMIHQALESISLSKLTINSLDLQKGTIEIPGGRRYQSRILPLAAPQIMEHYHYLHHIRPQLDQDQTTDKLLANNYKYYRDAHKVLLQELKAQYPYLTPIKGGIPRQIRYSVIIGWAKRYNLRETQYRAGFRKVSSVETLLKTDIENLRQDIDTYFPLKD